MTDPAMAAPDLQPLMSHVPLPVAGYDVPAEGSGDSVWLGLPPAEPGPGQLRLADPGPGPGPGSVLPRRARRPQHSVVAAVRMTREIGGEHALAGGGSRGRTGDTGVRTSAEIAAYIRRALVSYHHQVGTCRMGIDRLAVVDPSLRGAWRAGAAGSRRLRHAGRHLG